MVKLVGFFKSNKVSKRLDKFLSKKLGIKPTNMKHKSYTVKLK